MIQNNTKNIKKKCPICLQYCTQIFVERKWEYFIYKCSSCSIEYADPLKTTSYANDPRIKIGYRRRLELVGSYIGWAHRELLKSNLLNQKTRVLEIGCGTGDFIHLLKEKGINAIGVDLGVTAIEAGKQYWGDIPIFTISAQDYFKEHNNQKFQIVCLFAILEHLEKPHSILNEIYRILDKNGYVVIEVPNSKSPLMKIYRPSTRYIDYPPQHLTRWNKKSISLFLTLHKFKLIYYATSKPSLSDIIPDIMKIYAPGFISTKTMIKISAIIQILLKPVDYLVNSFIKEGRSLYIIAQKE